jgi:hypothetical protein
LTGRVAPTAYNCGVAGSAPGRGPCAPSQPSPRHGPWRSRVRAELSGSATPCTLSETRRLPGQAAEEEGRVARPFPPMWRPLRPPWGEKVRLTQRVEIDVRRRASDNCGFAGSAPGLRALRSDPTGRAVTGSCWRTPLARRPVRQSHVRYAPYAADGPGLSVLRVGYVRGLPSLGSVSTQLARGSASRE